MGCALLPQDSGGEHAEVEGGDRGSLARWGPQGPWSQALGGSGGAGRREGGLLGASRPAGADLAGLAHGLWAPELVRGSRSRMQLAISKNAVGASGVSCR